MFGDTVRVRTLLDQGAENIEATLRDDPEIGAQLLGVLGEVYNNLGLYDEEIELRERAVGVRDRAVARRRRMHNAQLQTEPAVIVAAEARRVFLVPIEQAPVVAHGIDAGVRLRRFEHGVEAVRGLRAGDLLARRDALFNS